MSNLFCPAVSLCDAFGKLYFQHLLVYGDRIALSAETTFQASTDGVMGSMVNVVRLDLPSPLMHTRSPQCCTSLLNAGGLIEFLSLSVCMWISEINNEDKNGVRQMVYISAVEISRLMHAINFFSLTR